jgi:hypothetical protein
MRPSAVGVTVDVGSGGGTGSGTLVLDATDLAALNTDIADGVGEAIRIGWDAADAPAGADGTAAITVGGATFQSPTQFVAEGAGGSVVFTGAFNGNDDATLDVDAAAITLGDGGGDSITTTGNTVRFGGPVTLEDNFTVSTGGGFAGNIDFDDTATIDDGTGGPWNLTLTAGTGDVTFGDALGAGVGQIGGTQPIADLQVNGTGVTFFSNTAAVAATNVDINATGAVDINGSVTTTGATGFASDGTTFDNTGGSIDTSGGTGGIVINHSGAITAAAGLTSAGGAVDIDSTGSTADVSAAVNTTTGAVTIDSNGGTTLTDTGDVTTTGAGGTITIGANDTGTITTGAELTTSGETIRIARPVTLTDAVTISTGGGAAGNIDFDDAATINDGAGGPWNLTLTAGTGDVTFGDAAGAGVGRIGETQPIADLQVNGTGVTFFSNTAAVAATNVDINATGAVDINGSVTTTGATGFASDGTTFDNTGGSIDTSGGTGGIVINHSGAITAAAGLTSAGGAVDIDSTGSTADVSAAVNTTTGAVTIDSNGGTTLTDTGDVTTTGAGGTITIGANDTGTITTGAELTTSGETIRVARPVTLTDAVTISTGGGAAGNIDFDDAATINDGAGGPWNLTLTAGTGDVTFGDAPGAGVGRIGGTQPIADLEVNGTGVTFFSNTAAVAATNVDINATGAVDINGSVTTTGATGFASDGTTFDNTGGAIDTSGGTGGIAVNHSDIVTVGASLTSDSGAVSLTTTAAQADILVNAGITTNAGPISLSAGDSVDLASVTVTTGAGVGGNIGVTVNTDTATSGATGDAILMNADTVFQAGTGTVTLTADGADAGNVQLGDVRGATVSVSAQNSTDTNSIVEAGADGGADVTATTFSATAGADIGGVGTEVEVTIDSVNAVSNNGGDIYLVETSGVTLTSVTTAGGTVSVVDSGGDIAVGSVDAGAAGSVILDASAAGEILDAAADAVVDITAASIDLDAATGVGATAGRQLETSRGNTAYTVDSTAGNIDIDHTAVGAAVSVGALNTGGTGTINFDQTGAQALTITSSTTNDGTITITNDDGNLTATSVTAGNAGDVSLTTTTSGNVLLGSVDATGDQITINSAGAIDDATAANNTNDLVAATIDLTAASGGIGQNNGSVDTNATVSLSAHTTADNGSIHLYETAGDMPIGLIDAAAGTVQLDATAAAEILDAVNDTTVDINAASIDLDAATGIGATATRQLETRRGETAYSADSTAGNIDIDHTAVGAAVTLTTLTTGGTGTINFDQTGGENLTVTAATTNDGDLTITNDSANLIIDDVTAGGTNTAVLRTTTSGDIDETAVDDAAADVTADAITLNAAGGIGAAGLAGEIEIDLGATVTSALSLTSGGIAGAGDIYVAEKTGTLSSSDITISTAGGSAQVVRIRNRDAGFAIDSDTWPNTNDDLELRASSDDGATNAADNIAINNDREITVTGAGTVLLETVAAVTGGGTANTDIVAAAGSLTVRTASGFGTAGNPIETEVATLDLVNSASGEVAISETDSLNINQLDQTGGGAVSVVAEDTGGGTITVVNGQSGVVWDSGSVTLDADVDVVVNAAVGDGGTSGTLIIDADNDVTFGAAGDVTTTSAGAGISIDIEADQDGSNVGGVSMADGALINGGDDRIVISAYDGVSLGGLLTTDNGTGAGTAAVEITSTNGGVSDAGDTHRDVDAANGELEVSAASGIGSGDALETTVAQVRLNNTNGTPSGTIEIAESDAVTVAEIDNDVADDTTAATGAIELVAGGTITVANGGVGVIAIDGDITLTATGANSDIDIAQVVTTDSSGGVTMTADDSVTVSNAAGDITASGSGNVSVTANADNANGDSNDVIDMVDGAVIDAGSGTITLDNDTGAGTDGGTITLGGLTTSSADAAAVTINSDADVADGGDTDEDIDAANGTLVVRSRTGFGTVANAIDVTVTTLDLVNSASGEVAISETDSLNINQLDQTGGGAVSVVAEDGGGGTITVVNGQSGVVWDNGSVTLDADVDVVVNEAVGDGGTSGTLIIDADNDVTFGAAGDVTTTSAGAGISIDIEADQDGSNVGGVSMADGALINGGDDRIVISAYDGVSLGGLLTTDNGMGAGTAAVEITSTNGGVSDAGDTHRDVDAANGELEVSAASGIGSGDALETTVAQVRLNNTNGTPSGTIEIAESDAVTVAEIDNDVADDTTAATGAIELVAGGTITVANGGVGVIAIDGDITLTATGANSDIDIAQEITTDSSGGVTITADDSVTVSNAAGDVTASGGGNVRVTANADNANGDSNDVISMVDGAVIGAGSGTITLDNDTGAGTDGGTITLGGLTTSSADPAAVTINSDADVVDGGDTDEDIDAANGTLVVRSRTGFGTVANAMDVTITTLDLVNSASGEVAVSETDSLDINQLDQTGGGAVSVVAEDTGGGTITVVNGQSGVVWDSGSVTLDADVDVVVNEAVGDGGTSGTLVIDADNDVTFGAAGDVTTTSAGAGISIDIEADQDGSNAGGVSMADGALINGGDDRIVISAYDGVSLGGLLTTDNGTGAGTAAVEITSTNGGVSDAGDTHRDVDAANGELEVSAASGIGSGDALETTVAQVRLNNTNGTPSGTIEIAESDAVTVAEIDNDVADDTTAATGAIELVAGGTITVANGGVGVIAIDGDITLTATGANSDIDIAQVITTDSSGGVTITADDSVTVSNAAGDITASGSGNVSVTANADDSVGAGDTGEIVSMADGAAIDAGSGTVAISTVGATNGQGGRITVGRVVTTSASTTAVIVTTDADVVDGGDGGGVDIDAANGRLVIDSVSGIGAVDPGPPANADLEVTVASVDIDNTTNGAVAIVETDDLEVWSVQQDAAAALTLTLTGTTPATDGELTISDGTGNGDPDLFGNGAITIIEGNSDGISIGGATSVDGITLDGTELSRITALSLELQTGGDVAIDSVPQAASDAIDTLIVNATGSTAFTGASVFDALTVTSAAGITIDNDANATTPVAEIDADTGNIFFGDTVTFNTGTELGDGTVVLLTASNGGTIDFAGAGTAADQSTNAVNVRIEAGSLDISGGGQFDFGAQDLYLYTHNDTTAMNIGTGAAAAFHVSDGEIATLSGTGTVRFGEDAAQSGTITIETVAIPAGANNASAATYEFFSNAGAGTIILNDGSGASTAFATSGAGAVDFTAGTGSIYTPNASNLVAEISTTGTINLDSAGQIGDDSIITAGYAPIQFPAGTDDINIVGNGAPGGAWLEGIGGDITMGSVDTQGGLLDIGTTGANNIFLTRDIDTLGSSITFRRPVILDPPGVVGAGTAVADTISIDTGSTPAGSAGDIAFNGTLDAELAGADHLRVTAFDGAAAFGNVTFGDGGGTDDVGGSFSARMGDITIVNAAAVTVETNAPVTATTWTQSAGSGLFRLRAALDVNGAGGVDINSNSVTLDAAGDITSAAGAVSVNGTGGGVASIRTAADVTTTNQDVTFATQVTLTGPVAIDTGAVAGDVTFVNTVNGGQDLTLDAGTGNVVVQGAVGGSTRLGDVTIVDADNVAGDSGAGSDAASIRAATVTQQNGAGETRLGAVNTNAAGGVHLGSGTPLNDVTLNGGVTTTGGGPLTIDAAGAVTLTDTAGIADTAVDLDLDGAFSQLGGATPVNVDADITTTNDAVSFADALTLTGNVSIDTGTGAAGTVTFLSAVNGDGVAGNEDLSIDTAQGAVDFQAAVGSTNSVGAVTVDTIGGGTGGDVDFQAAVDDTGAISVTSGEGGSGDTTFAGVIGGATAAASLTVTAQNASFVGIGNGGSGVTGNVSVDANDQVTLGGVVDYWSGGTQRYDGLNVGAVIATAAASTPAFTAAGAGFTFRDLFVDAPNSTITFNGDVAANDFIFYRGTIDIGTNNVSLATSQNGGGDFVVFGPAYSADDVDRAAASNEFAYPPAAAPGLAYELGGSYTSATGAWGVATDATWATFTDLTGASITVGTGGTGDFYVNGVDLLGGGWNLAVQDTRGADPVGNGPFGSPYAVFFNGDVENSTVTAGQISAASPAVSALDGAVTHRNNNVTADGAAVVPTAPGAFSLPYTAPAIPDTTNTDLGSDNPNAGWDFVAPYLVYAQTVRDDVIRLTFSEAIENSNNEISAAVAQIFADAGGDAMAEALVDVSSTPNEVPYSFATTDAREDLITFYVRTSGPAWATDATGTTASVSGIGYDRTGVRWDDPAKDGGAGVVPDLRMLKATLYDAASNTPIVNYGYNQDGGANPFPTFDETSDAAGAVLYEIRYGRAAHNKPVATPYDGHNYFHLYYSEPVSIGTNPAMSAVTPTAENLRNEASLGGVDNRGGDTRNAGGDILIDGFFQFSYSDPRVTGPMERGARDAGTVQSSAHSLFRSDSFGVDPFTPWENANELRIYLSGYNSDDAWGGPDANGGFLGWHANVPNPGTVTAVTVPANGAILDGTGANAVDHQLSTAVIANALDPEPDGSDVPGAGGIARPGYTVGVADPEDTDVQFPGGTAYQNDWDVITPFFSSFSLDLGSADNTPETFEIVSLDSDLNGLIDTIEFHILDNSAVLDYRNILDDFAPDPQGLGIVLDEDGNPYPTPSAAAGDTRPLWDPENSSEAPDPVASLFTHPNLRPNEGIRDFSFFDLSNDPDPLTAFAIERVDITPLLNDVVDGFSTNVDNIFFGTVLTANDGYFRIDLDETQHNWDLLTELYLTYDESVGRFTDLAGNLMPSTALPIRAIERTPPRIEISLGVAGDDRLYLKFSEPVFGDQDRSSDITFEDLVVPGNPPTGLDVVSRSTQPGSGSGGITEVFLRLTDPIEPDDAFSGRIRPADSSAIFDKAQNAMPEIDERRLTDVALGVIEPIWATDSFGTNDAGVGDFRTIRSFDGTAELSLSDITVQSRLLTSVYSGLPVSLLFDLNVSDEDRVSDLIEPSTVGRFWSPDPIPGIVSRGQISPARSVLAYEVDGVLRNFIIPRNDSEMRQGGPMEFLFRVGPLTAANLTDPTDPRTLAPWLLNIGDGFIVQRSNVTILNNVIYPERGESTVLVYDIDRPGMVTVTVFGLDGSVIRSLHRGRQGTGSYRFGWDGRNNTGQIVARGIYFIRVVAPGVDEYRKVIIAKD